MTAGASTGLGTVLDRYEAVIGLEVHVQLRTASKIFCGCGTRYGAPPNTQICPVCLGYPGALPTLNAGAVKLAVVAASALGCTLHSRSIFARKHYFYPDLPKGYQISQFDQPLATNGSMLVTFESGERAIGITRVHLEEDAGKSSHEPGGTRIDFNRCGIPLIEIVSEPDLRSPPEAHAYLRAMKQTLEYLDVSDCNMEEGSLRCDANVSIRPRGTPKLGTKTEVKNVNSFRYVQDALAFEIRRQAEVLDGGDEVVHETRLWDSERGEARPMRSKELSHDYRYFPEPDLEPLIIAADEIEAIAAGLPEMPAARARRFETEHGLSAYDAGVLTSSRGMADFFEITLASFADAKEVANWVMGEVLRVANELDQPVRVDPEPGPVRPNALADLLAMKAEGTISGSAAKDVLSKMATTGDDPRTIVEREGLQQVSDTDALEVEIDAVIAEHPDEVAAYRGGKTGLLSFFVGQVMRRTRGQANPKRTSELLSARLDRSD